ncbi:hypothetical protein [Pseudoalteromonas sp. XMcav11-Q]|uniref:hypothetical protein n=1 Tax=Pseudoalteromonas sp. XMcav11-Q TaxID=3136665 RepID=UPI0032C419E4
MLNQRDIVSKFSFPQVFSEVELTKISGDIVSFIETNVSCIFDFTKLQWIGPIPIMWLTQIIIREKSRRSLNVTILVSINGGREHGRLLNFLYSHGFISLLNDYVDFKDVKSSDVGLKIFGSIEKYRNFLNYQNSQCVKVKVKNVSDIKGSDFDCFIDEIVDEANESLLTKVGKRSLFQKDHVIQKLRHFSTELTENVIDHAYDGTLGTICFFAKIRAGKNKLEHPDLWTENLGNEIKRCFQLQKWEDYTANQRSIWVEVFICDIGKGLFSSVYDWKTEDQIAQKLLNELKEDRSLSPLRKIGHKILSGGFSSTLRKGVKSLSTGFQLIHETLRSKEGKGDVPGDFIRVLTGDEVIAGHLPFDRGESVGGCYKKLDNSLPDGTFFHSCIELSDDGVLSLESFYEPSEESKTLILKELQGLTEIKALDLLTVDQRYLREIGENYDSQRRPFNIFTLKDKKYKDVKEEFSWKIDDGYIEFDHAKHLVWLPPDSVKKFDITEWLRQSLKSNLNSLTIADIPTHRAFIFEYITSTEKISVDRSLPESPLLVYIITRDWQVATFKAKREKNIFRFEIVEDKELVNKLGLSRLNKKLRENDSKSFWNRASKSFIPEKVVWRTPPKQESDLGLEIDGYIDFSSSITDRINYKVIKSSIERTLAIWSHIPVNRKLIVGMDDLVCAYSSDINFLDFSEFMSNGRLVNKDVNLIILLGSTCVSGETFDSLKNLIRCNFIDVEIIPLFVFLHPNFNNSHGKAIGKLLNWSPKAKIKDQKVVRKAKYERISGTPYIKRGGNKSYQIERNDNGFYESKMYREFSVGHLKLGHWEYGKSHDLLTPNLSRIISTNPEMTRWLIERILRTKGTGSTGTKNYIVYIFHEVTKKMIAKLRDVNPKIEKDFEFLTLHKLNSGIATATFFSPLSIEKVNDYIKKGVNKVNVVLIDDGVITGDTLRNAENAFNLRSDDKLTTISIIDRAGFSVNTSLLNGSIHERYSYWKWDVPALGSLGHCKLCRALDILKALAPENSFINKTVKRWINTWSKQKLTDSDWENSGVTPQRLTKNIPMKFANIPVKQSFAHSISTTLNSMSIEISNSSFQPDFVFNKFSQFVNDDKELNDSVKLELITSHLLLLGDSISLPKKAKIYCGLLELVWDFEYSNSYTSLLGLCFFGMEESLKSVVWEKAEFLIDEKGLTYDGKFDRQDLELICFSLLYQKEGVDEVLENKVNNAKSEESKTAYSFLLSLVTGVEHICEPVIQLYKMFGYEGIWHTAKFDDILQSLNILGTHEIESHQKLSLLLDEVLTIFDSLMNVELIASSSHSLLTEQFKVLKDRMLIRSINNAEIQNVLMKSKIYNKITEYSHASIDLIEREIRREINDFLEPNNFYSYYNAKSSKRDIYENWENSPPEINLDIAKNEGNITGKFLFFMPFRSFIRDTIYNSIWVKHGVDLYYSLSIKIKSDEDFINIYFESLVPKDKFNLQPRDYHTRINQLKGDYLFSFECEKETLKFIITLRIPTVEKFRGNLK